ncbi:HNH endonuclease [Erysipelothrix sp. HDW6C]|uniref:HNH endonuclease n=1 Tax=Erysipelothrix sp. HDW6C TaxID=2714930 RepID=UPI001409CD27|nr:HNH endonuclease [Erysipelothrix sp. HDW6C]
MSKRTKALEITQKTKKIVWERDGECCINCGEPQAMPNSHVIPRSKGGLGIEQNVVTHCASCHRIMDQGVDEERTAMKNHAIEYVKRLYPNWSIELVTYRR